MMHLDTHIAVLLYDGRLDKLDKKILHLLDTEELKISSIVRLELKFLYEIGKIKLDPDKIIEDLRCKLGVDLHENDMNLIVHHAMDLAWTRDPFDRLIVAAAACESALLLTKDRHILENYQRAVWR